MYFASAGTAHAQTATPDEIAQLFSALDKDQSGSISKEEAVAIRGLSEQWDTYDLNTDGVLDEVEFARLVRVETDGIVVTGSRINWGGGFVTFPFDDYGGGWDDWGGGGYDPDEEENCPIQQKDGATKQEAPCPPPEPEPDVCTPEMTLLADAMARALADPRARVGEFGGLLYRRIDGTLGMTNRLYRLGSSVPIFDSRVPIGATILYGWHTHPSGSAQFFSWQDYITSQPEYVSGDISSGSPNSFLGLAMGQVIDRRFFFLADASINTGEYTFSSRTIMDFAEEITRCVSTED